MGFIQLQRAIDVCAAAGELRGEWALVFWLARHCDQDSSEIRRSQARLATELGCSERWIREYLKRWKERGVVQVVRHGGGPKRTVAVLKVSMRSLEDYMLRLQMERAKRQSPEAQGVPELNAEIAERKLATSGVRE